MILKEGGNAFPDVVDIKKEYAKDLINSVKRLLPGYDLQFDIGSVGYKIQSGDMDVFMDQDEVMNKFRAKDEKTAKQEQVRSLWTPSASEESWVFNPDTCQYEPPSSEVTA